MSDPVAIAVITVIGGTVFTGILEIIKLRMTLKTTSVTNKVKETTDEARQESKDGFTELKALVMAQNESIKTQQAMLEQLQKAFAKHQEKDESLLEERLSFLLMQHQGKTTITYAEKKRIDRMFAYYTDDGGNGTIKTMYENVLANIKVV